jgi:hypothetical protein
VDGPQQGTINCIDSQYGMQQQPANLATLSDWTKAAFARPPPAKAQLAAILDRKDFSAVHTLARACTSMLSHF